MEREAAYRSVQSAANLTIATGDHFGGTLAQGGIEMGASSRNASLPTTM
ncbi:hypothetical protein NKH18_02200 [Streptomyces sp. M10(2022)]